jgi:hypothetical protein
MTEKAVRFCMRSAWVFLWIASSCRASLVFKETFCFAKALRLFSTARNDENDRFFLSLQ